VRAVDALPHGAGSIVRVPRAPWLADFRSELLKFPAGRHDDRVDAIGLVGQLPDKMVPPAKPKRAAKPVRDRWAPQTNNVSRKVREGF
jgi:hypothetical protein